MEMKKDDEKVYRLAKEKMGRGWKGNRVGASLAHSN